ncbi:MAG: sulfatase-like hydrolase/transferase [Gammaproteobacteria bacterium]|nr:sulfatase-like hydrolase/transferase [Gammaproteobacteria bacterium]
MKNLIVAALSLCLLVATNASGQIKPNIIIMMTDDMGIGDAGPYLGIPLGPNTNPVRKTLVTPNLERLAAQGMVFTDVHTTSSMCSPSRYAMLTGRYPWRTYNKHKVIGDWATRPMISPGRPTLATLLRQNGYRTSAIGKWHLGFSWIGKDGKEQFITESNQANWNKIQIGNTASGYLKSIFDGPLAHGFDNFFGLGGNFYHNKRYSIKAYINNNSFVGVPSWNGAPGNSIGPGVSDWDQQRIGQRYITEALGYIDEHVADAETKPFFLYYVPNANHEPHNPPNQLHAQGRSFPIRNQARFSNGSDGALRDDMVYENDISLGLLLDKLAALNDPRTGRPLSESTLFIFTSDNGADRPVGQSANAGLRGKKGSLYEGGHRVPFMVVWPDGGVPSGAISNANFSQVDMYASLASLINHTLGPDEAEDSANVLTALLGQETDSQFQRSHLLVSHDDKISENDLPNDSVLAIHNHPFTMMIDGQLVNRNKVNGKNRGQAVPIKLFDLDADPHQDTNVLAIPANQSLVTSLTERLLHFHNQGFSRSLKLDTGPILHTDGGANLMNNRDGAIGYEFTVGNQPVAVQSLGMWDDGTGDYLDQETSTKSDGQTVGNPDGLHVTHTVRLFDASSRNLLASVVVNNDNSYLEGEFRYVNLAQSFSLGAGQTFALTVDTNSGDGDLFHHFAAHTAVSPSPSSLIGNFIARVAANAGAYPDQYPDGSDGVGNRHSDMFQHRMFVGPNARIVTERTMNAAPIVTINGAHNGTSVILGTVLNFMVSAYDGEDGDVSAGVSWHSSIDGNFGLGASVSHALSLGIHTITALVTDSSGQSDSQTITVKVTENGDDPVDINPNGAPAYNPSTDRGIVLWRQPDQSWRVRAAGGGRWANYTGTITADQSFAYVSPYSLEGTDTLNNSIPSAVSFKLAMTKGWDDGFDFTILSSAKVCFDIDMPDGAEILVGAAREPVVPPFNLADFKPCAPTTPSINPDGAPAYNPATDRGIVLWRQPDQSWRVRAAGGGRWANYTGTITADQSFSYVSPYSLEGTDTLNNSIPSAVSFKLAMTKGWDDGFDFTTLGSTNVCFDVTLPKNAKILVGPSRTEVSIPFNLADFGSCN